MSIIKAIGNTPLIELQTINPFADRVRVMVKLEGANPSGSVKDRPALFMIREAERSKELTHKKTILEATSGNTGIALAMIGAVKGYKVTLCMPGCVSEERQRILRAFGAEVILTDSCARTDGAIYEAQKLFEQYPGKYYMPNQFVNQYNSQAHFETTGPEIWEQTNGAVDVFIAGMGTTGTLMGTGSFLKQKNPDMLLIGVEPEPQHSIQGLKNMEESIVPALYNPALLDDCYKVDDDSAFEMTRRLTTEEGIFVGISSGAAVVGALRIAEQLSHGTVVSILPDRGERYLSTTLFRSFCAECPP